MIHVVLNDSLVAIMRRFVFLFIYIRISSLLFVRLNNMEASTLWLFFWFCLDEDRSIIGSFYPSYYYFNDRDI